MTDITDDLVSDAEQLGEASEIEVIARLVPLAGSRVVDIGCGSGRVTRELVRRGAVAIGIEPDPIQAAKNRQSAPVLDLEFVEAPGQRLPLDDDTIDVALFSYSLHHVPAEHMAAALDEAIRILKPCTGTLLVMEPMLSGSMEAVYRPFHDETLVRRAAYEAVKCHAARHFAEAREVCWHESVRYAAFETFVAENVSSTHTNFTRDRIDTPEVRTRFEAGRTGDGFTFTQHVRINLFRGRLKPGRSQSPHQ